MDGLCQVSVIRVQGGLGFVAQRLPDCRHRRGARAARCLPDRVLRPLHIVPTRGVPSGRARCPRKVRADFQTQVGRDWTAASPANAADGRGKVSARFSARRHRIQKRSGPCESPLPIDRPVEVRGRHDKERAGSLASPPALALRLRRKFIHRADRRRRKEIFDFSRAGKRDRNVYQSLQGDLPRPFKKLVGGGRKTCSLRKLSLGPTPFQSQLPHPRRQSVGEFL